jgi:hypothetical protein
VTFPLVRFRGGLPGEKPWTAYEHIDIYAGRPRTGLSSARVRRSFDMGSRCDRAFLPPCNSHERCAVTLSDEILHRLFRAASRHVLSPTRVHCLRSTARLVAHRHFAPDLAPPWNYCRSLDLHTPYRHRELPSSFHPTERTRICSGDIRVHECNEFMHEQLHLSLIKHRPRTSNRKVQRPLAMCCHKSPHEPSSQ